MNLMDLYVNAIDQLVEKTLTPAEKKKKEEIAKAIERDNPEMPMDKKMAIATATAKKVAEENEIEEGSGSYRGYDNSVSDRARLRQMNTIDSKSHTKLSSGASYVMYINGKVWKDSTTKKPKEFKTYDQGKKAGETIKSKKPDSKIAVLPFDSYKTFGDTYKPHLKEETGDKKEYQKFFQSALKKFGIKSPSELSGDKEKEFYDYVDANWDGDNESD